MKRAKIFFALILGLCMLPAIAGAEIYPVTKTELVNVAEFKPITSSDIHAIPDYPISNLTDGDRGTFMMSECGPEEAASEELTIDLLRRCKIEKIELYDRYDVDRETGRQYVDIIGANKADFSDAVTLGSFGAQDDTKFPHQGKLQFNLDGKSAYRYIKLKRTGGGDYNYAELKVYAKQTMTDVSRGALRENIITDALSDERHWIYDFATPEKAFDGDSATMWLEDGNAYRYLRVDLGKEYPIGLIELNSRADGADTFWSRKYINIYGTKSDDTENSIFDPYLAPDDAALAEAGFRKLIKIGINDVFDGECAFPAPYIPDGYDETTYGKTGYLQATCDDSVKSRYIIFKNYLSMGAALSNFGAYVINPEPVEVYVNGDYVYITFSDEMDFSDLSGVQMTGASFSKEDSYTIKANISSLDKNAQHTVLVSNLSSKLGTSMADTYNYTLENLHSWIVGDIKLYDDNVEIKDFHNTEEVTIKAQVSNNSGKPLSVIAILGLYREDGRLLKASISEPKEIPIQGKDYAEATISFDSVSEDCYLKAFILEEEGFTPLCDAKTFYNRLTSIYVAPNGDDNYRGTLEKPFLTLERAQQEIRENNSDMNEDITVYVRGGTYELSDTLMFTDADSATDGHFVNWTNYENEDVVISGGTKIEGFTEVSEGIWAAPVTDERITSIRELYVNGQKAVRAKSENKIAPLSFYEENGEIAGYYVDSSEIPVFKNAGDIQLHYARGWSSVVLNVESMEDAGDGRTIIKMSQPEFSMMTYFEHDENSSNPTVGKLYHIFWLDEQNKFYMENAYELLDEEGEFYFDKGAGMLYYKFSGESMDNVEVFAPRLEKILTISGSDMNNKAENITFSGFTFAHSAYNDFDNGILGDQAQTKMLVEAPKSSYAPDNLLTGANIRISKASDIRFTNNVFYGLAAVGIGLYEGAENVKISENTFYDIGDSAITVGFPSDAYVRGNEDGVNVALFKPTSASYEDWGNFSAYINDGDAKRGWNMIWDGDYRDDWVQIDLEKAYTIDRIVLKQREGEIYTQDRRNFTILGSNYPDFSDGGYVLISQGEEVYSDTGAFTGYVTDTRKYRYIRVIKTQNEYSYFPEIEIITYDTTAPVQEVCKNNEISGNYITRAGEFNWGAPGIQTYYTEGTKILQNTLYDLPYSGICVGWGWTNTPDSITSKNNEVRNNKISDYALICYDAGGVYTLGQEPGSIIDGNYIKNQLNAYAAYYPDSGSSQFTVTNNVFENIDMSCHIYSQNQSYLTVYDNWSTTPRHKDLGYECDFEAPTVFLPTDVPEEAQAIINNAGADEALAEKAPARKKARTFEEMYGNILEENNNQILSMPASVLAENYLNSKVQEAESVITLMGERGDEALKTALSEKITEAKAMVKNASKTDKLDILNERFELIDCMKAYYNSIN